MNAETFAPTLAPIFGLGARFDWKTPKTPESPLMLHTTPAHTAGLDPRFQASQEAILQRIGDFLSVCCIAVDSV